jgi:hypothetical protein
MSTISSRFEKILRGDWKPEQMVSWLRGEGWPPGGWQGEPYRLLLESVPRDAGQGFIREKMARAAAELLEQCTRKSPKVFGALPGVVLSNLFSLSAGLALPSILGGPLNRMKTDRGAYLKGSQHGIPFTSLLIEALAENQAGLDLKSYWLALLDQERGVFPEGTPFDGFRGLIKCGEKAGIPEADNIAAAIGLIAQYLEEKLPNRQRRTMRDLYDYVESYFDLSRVPWRRVFELPDSQIPAWAVDCFPSRLFPIKKSAHQVIIPVAVMGCLPAKYKPLIKWEKDCFRGAACLVSAKNGAFAFLYERATPIFEQHRISGRFESPAGRDAMLVHALLDLEESSANADDRDFYRSQRRQLLKSTGILEKAHEEVASVGRGISLQLASVLSAKQSRKNDRTTRAAAELLGPLAPDIWSHWMKPSP